VEEIAISLLYNGIYQLAMYVLTVFYKYYGNKGKNLLKKLADLT